jgi:hypothetical protein
MDFSKIASKITEVESVLEPITEYSCQVELSITVNFEGNVDKENLLNKVKYELTSAVQTGMTTVARDFDLKSNGATIHPIKMQCDSNSDSLVEEEIIEEVNE